MQLGSLQPLRARPMLTPLINLQVLGEKLTLLRRRTNNAPTVTWFSLHTFLSRFTARARDVAGTCGRHLLIHPPLGHSTPSHFCSLRSAWAREPPMAATCMEATPYGGRWTPSGCQLSWLPLLDSQTHCSGLSPKHCQLGLAQKVWSGWHPGTSASSCPLALRFACCRLLLGACAGLRTAHVQDGPCTAGTPLLWQAARFCCPHATGADNLQTISAASAEKRSARPVRSRRGPQGPKEVAAVAPQCGNCGDAVEILTLPSGPTRTQAMGACPGTPVAPMAGTIPTSSAQEFQKLWILLLRQSPCRESAPTVAGCHSEWLPTHVASPKAPAPAALAALPIQIKMAPPGCPLHSFCGMRCQQNGVDLVVGPMAKPCWASWCQTLEQVELTQGTSGLRTGTTGSRSVSTVGMRPPMELTEPSNAFVTSGSWASPRFASSRYGAEVRFIAVDETIGETRIPSVHAFCPCGYLARDASGSHGWDPTAGFHSGRKAMFRAERGLVRRLLGAMVTKKHFGTGGPPAINSLPVLPGHDDKEAIWDRITGDERIFTQIEDILEYLVCLAATKRQNEQRLHLCTAWTPRLASSSQTRPEDANRKLILADPIHEATENMDRIVRKALATRKECRRAKDSRPST